VPAAIDTARTGFLAHVLVACMDSPFRAAAADYLVITAAMLCMPMAKPAADRAVLQYSAHLAGRPA
jgi:hypothetical protein